MGSGGRLWRGGLKVNLVLEGVELMCGEWRQAVEERSEGKLVEDKDNGDWWGDG